MEKYCARIAPKDGTNGFMVANQSKVTILTWLRLSKFFHHQIMCQLAGFIAGGKVSITCMDDRSRVVYYGSDATDELGQFDIIVNKYINGKELKAKLCSVRLVSSPDSTCNILTDFAGGKRGVKLNLPSLVYRDQIKYTLGPFYFTKPLCDEPNTTDSDDTHGGHY